MLSSPSWLILLWSGLAATLIAATVIAPLAAPIGARGSLAYMRPRSVPDFLLLLLLGLFVYPAIYGVILDGIHVASILSGAMIGLLHGTAVFFATGARNDGARALQAVVLSHVGWGAVLGFLYVTP